MPSQKQSEQNSLSLALSVSPQVLCLRTWSHRNSITSSSTPTSGEVQWTYTPKPGKQGRKDSCHTSHGLPLDALPMGKQNSPHTSQSTQLLGSGQYPHWVHRGTRNTGRRSLFPRLFSNKGQADKQSWVRALHLGRAASLTISIAGQTLKLAFALWEQLKHGRDVRSCAELLQVWILN